GRAAAGPPRPPAAADPAGRDARRGRDPGRLPLPSPLPDRGSAVLGGGSGARAALVERSGTPGGLPAPPDSRRFVAPVPVAEHAAWHAAARWRRLRAVSAVDV